MWSASTRIECSHQPLDLSFHPSKPTLVAAALVDGSVEVHDYGQLTQDGNNKTIVARAIDHEDVDDDDENDSIISSMAVHTRLIPNSSVESSSGFKQESCRAVQFSHQGQYLFTAGSSGDWVGLDAERACTFHTLTQAQPLWRISGASLAKSPIQVLHEISPASSSSQSPLLVTGDEAGCVRVWDVRICCAGSNGHGTVKAAPLSSDRELSPGCVLGWKKHNDYISGFAHADDGFTLLAASADATLSVYDLRMLNTAISSTGRDQINSPPSLATFTSNQGFVRRSDDQEDELLSIQIMKHGQKVVCGTAEGVLCVWSWGVWGDRSDSFPGHPASVDALLKVDENTLLTGSSDGLIRVVSIQPDKLLGVLGDHDGFPIEKLDFNADRSMVGSITHDNYIRLWDARILNDADDDDDVRDQGDADMMNNVGDEGATHMDFSQLPKGAKSSVDEEVDSDDDEDGWEDMDEDAEEEDDDDSDDSDADRKPAAKKGGKRGRLKSENEKFFKDL